MPIQVTCQCGKRLNAPDAAAGKPVKCPGCGKNLRVPSGKAKQPAAKTSTKKSAAARPAPAAGTSGDLGDLFDEEGFSTKVESVCPSCRVEMPAAAVLCTKCGFNRETGEMLESHKTAGVDIDHGTLALEKAAVDIVKDREMQQTLLKGGGMPWWMLVMVLVIGGGALGLATLAVNSANQETEYTGPPLLAGVLMLTGATLSFASIVCSLMVVIHAFKQSIVQGLLTLLVPFYVFYHVFNHRRDVLKIFIMAMVLGVAGGVVFNIGYEKSGEVAEPEDDNGLRSVL